VEKETAFFRIQRLNLRRIFRTHFEVEIYSRTHLRAIPFALCGFSHFVRRGRSMFIDIVFSSIFPVRDRSFFPELRGTGPLLS